MSKHLIPNSFVRWHFATLSEQPTLAESLKRQLNIPQQVFHEPGSYLTANQLARLISETILATDDESFGALSKSLGRGSFHMMAYACISCKTLEQVIQRARHFYALVNSQMQWRYVEEDEKCHLIFDYQDIQQSQAAYFIAFTSCVFWRFLSWIIDKPIPLDAVHFDYPCPQGVSEMGLLFRMEPQFSQGANRITFDKSFLDLRVKQNTDSLDKFLMHVPECLLSHYQEEISLSKQVREYLEQQDDLQGMSLQHVAEYFYCTEQSFIRYLRAEGVKYSDIRNQIKKQRAKLWLLTTQFTNQEISQKLGFADPTVFYRNCKKWFGLTPNQFRANNRP
ncbi:AraC family transcriptional regulator [Alteromonadaceae bacterium M269]|nr:AraC family transcriptional regulator [Alteromonadaceae bacterium M269]